MVEAQIVEHAALKQDRFLGHEAQLLAQAGELHVGQIEPIHEHATAAGPVEAVDQLHHRALAAAAQAHQAHEAAGVDLQVEAIELERAIGLVAEAHVLELHGAGDRPHRQLGVAGGFLRGLPDHIGHGSHRRLGIAELIAEAGEVEQRGCDAAGEQINSEDGAHAGLALQHQLGCHQEQQDLESVEHYRCALLERGAVAGEAVIVASEAPVATQPLEARFAGEVLALDGADRREHLHQQRLAACPGGVASGEQALAEGACGGGDQQQQGHLQQHDPGEHRLDGEQHRQQHRQEDQIDQAADGRVGEELAHLL